VARKQVRLIAVIRPDMPFPATAPHVPLSDFASVIEDDAPLITLADPPLSDEAKAIAANVATLLGTASPFSPALAACSRSPWQQRRTTSTSVSTQA
jgi:hypothetical protein